MSACYRISVDMYVDEKDAANIDEAVALIEEVVDHINETHDATGHSVYASATDNCVLIKEISL